MWLLVSNKSGKKGPLKKAGMLQSAEEAAYRSRCNRSAAGMTPAADVGRSLRSCIDYSSAFSLFAEFLAFLLAQQKPICLHPPFIKRVRHMSAQHLVEAVFLKRRSRRLCASFL